MNTRRFALALVVTLLAPGIDGAAAQEPERVVILVRHAETEFPADAEDPMPQYPQLTYNNVLLETTDQQSIT